MKRWKGFRMAAVLMAAILGMSSAVQAAATTNGTAAQVVTNSIAGWPAGPETISETAVLLDADTGAVLYDKGKDEIRYPASITKLMAALVAVEHSSLDEQVTFTETGVRDVTPDSGNIGMQLGEVMSMEDCLHAMLIHSANEVSAQVAEHVGGTEEQFIQMMNERAAELGCKNTNFRNASGLPDENHYSTAYDMALILQAGLKNEVFCQVLEATGYTIPATNLSGEKKMHTHLPLFAPESPFYYEGCIGGKTGYTSAAMNTLAVAARRDGRTYIVVTLRAPELGHNCIDSRALFDYAFQQFEQIRLEGTGAATVPVGITREQLEVQSLEEHGRQISKYYLNGQFVGNAVAVSPSPTPSPEPSSVPQEMQAPTEEIGDASEEPMYQEESETRLSQMAKILLYVMAGMFLLLIVLLIALFIKRRS